MALSEIVSGPSLQQINKLFLCGSPPCLTKYAND